MSTIFLHSPRGLSAIEVVLVCIHKPWGSSGKSIKKISSYCITKHKRITTNWHIKAIVIVPSAERTFVFRSASFDEESNDDIPSLQHSSTVLWNLIYNGTLAGREPRIHGHHMRSQPLMWHKQSLVGYKVPSNNNNELHPLCIWSLYTGLAVWIPWLTLIQPKLQPSL